MSYILRIRFLLLLVCSVDATAQAQDTIPVVMSNMVADSTVFGRRIVNTSMADRKITLKNIPGNIVDFRIKRRSLAAGLPDLHILHGKRTDGKRVVIIDSNFDDDMENEIIYVFEPDNSCQPGISSKVIDSIAPAEIRYPGLSPVFFKPSIYNCVYQYKQPEDSIWHLGLVVSNIKNGNFTINNKHYTILTSAHNRLPEFYIDTSDRAFPKNRNEHPPQLLHQTIYAGKTKFEVDRASQYFDTVWIIHKGQSDTAFGNRTGLFAEEIRSFTLDGNPFALSSLRGNFVLLDFWGSWCAPCIKLIPDLIQLSKKYKDNLKLVSIAYDRKENLDKLNKIIKDKQMDWIHLFTDQTKDDNLSSLYNVSTYPTSILIDPDGKILTRSVGLEHFDELQHAIDSHIHTEK